MAKKSRVHRFVIRVVFDKPVSRAEALHLAKGSLVGETFDANTLYVDAEDMTIKSVANFTDKPRKEPGDAS